jgi:hypothetical protein
VVRMGEEVGEIAYARSSGHKWRWRTALLSSAFDGFLVCGPRTGCKPSHGCDCDCDVRSCSQCGPIKGANGWHVMHGHKLSRALWCLLRHELDLCVHAWCSLSSAFIALAVCCPPFVATVIISTSNSPYKQWLVGGLVVLCDVAAAGAAGGKRTVSKIQKKRVQ